MTFNICFNGEKCLLLRFFFFFCSLLSFLSVSLVDGTAVDLVVKCEPTDLATD